MSENRRTETKPPHPQLLEGHLLRGKCIGKKKRRRFEMQAEGSEGGSLVKTKKLTGKEGPGSGKKRESSTKTETGPTKHERGNVRSEGDEVLRKHRTWHSENRCQSSEKSTNQNRGGRRERPSRGREKVKLSDIGHINQGSEQNCGDTEIELESKKTKRDGGKRGTTCR